MLVCVKTETGFGLEKWRPYWELPHGYIKPEGAGLAGLEWLLAQGFRPWYQDQGCVFLERNKEDEFIRVDVSLSLIETAAPYTAVMWTEPGS